MERMEVDEAGSVRRKRYDGKHTAGNIWWKACGGKRYGGKHMAERMLRELGGKMGIFRGGGKIRWGYGLAFLFFLIIEVAIALYVHDNFFRPYVGDMLVVIVVYCFVRIFIPEKCSLLPFYVFLFAAFVEGLQYFQLVKRLGLENCTFLRIVIGSVFDWKDVICYGIGCLVLWVYERI